jgi:GT2 family glycosyltransferase
VATPRFSVLTPVHETPADVLRAAIDSVRRQSFADWELCLVDDFSQQPHVRQVLAEAALKDSRVRVAYREANGGIVAASNDALAMANGEFVVLLDHDDRLHPEALELVDAAFRGTPEADYAYTDEDKLDAGGHHVGAFFKPDWSPERLRTQMYTCHLSVLRRSLVEEVGGFDPEFEGSQDWDLILKVSERAREVVHVPRVLYNWRMLESSAAGGGEEAKPWAFEAGTRAVQAHCERIGFPARVERDLEHPGAYHLQPELERRPPVSIVIPTAGQTREVRFEQVVLVTHCVRSIVETSTYDNYEIVCVADSSTGDDVLDELRAISGDRLRVVPYDRPFSFSAKINAGAVRSEGEHLLLLNDDMEVVTPDWLERLVMYSAHGGIGAVGGRLIWEDGRLQHVGVLFENGGFPGHPYRGFPGDFAGYSNSVLVAQNLLAVTGACLMTPREAFEEVGGLTTTFPVNYNDIDYCLKLRAKGLRVVYDPDTILYHFESSSRSADVDDWEMEMIVERWAHLTAPDPYSNPSLRYGTPRLSSPFKWARRGLPRRLRKARGTLTSR